MDYTGQQVREYRTREKLTQGQLAEMVGMTRDQIANIEVGRRSLALQEAALIAAALDVDVETFIDPEAVRGVLRASARRRLKMAMVRANEAALAVKRAEDVLRRVSE